MKAEIKKDPTKKEGKDFDAVELQHKLRIQLGKKISLMSREEEMEFFKKAAERAKTRRANK